MSQLNADWLRCGNPFDTMTAPKTLNEVLTLCSDEHACGVSLHQKCLRAFGSDFELNEALANRPRRLVVHDFHPEMSLSREELTYVKKKRLIDRSGAIDEHISNVLARST